MLSDSQVMKTLNPGSKRWKEFKAAFDFFDKDHSGKINVKEITQALASMGKNATDDEVKDIMASCDKNSDGNISFDEFIILIGPKSRFSVNQTQEEELKEQFRTFDLDGNGVITPDELKKVIIDFFLKRKGDGLHG